ncbi:protein mono-ADP-ribosyltransferase PARP8 isoform X2 [Oncorhynchus tshawytscha]|uniref:protein mono-ADP-ribosyltransferase PARP8 isoform X2 n=1 Tax=Oncorhynchus tshawytscha TaxID=74940 RepID=UPI001C3D2035|nr:protein mono-ADP-ribosyltransferase PARP8 isoform X2 [Oncorhynchus tshawytscha]
MGMCSRQERIQKDVNIVIQRSKAEKDCLFSDFRYTDATFTFTYSKGSRRVSYSVHVSDDYPDNTYVSNSENEDEVLVTRDPIPVIFHRISTEITINNDASCCLSIKTKLQLDKNQCHYAIEEDSEGDADSEEFYYGGQVNYDGELHKHPQLEADLAAVREMFGHHAVSLREYGAIDDVDIDLHIDVSFLDEEIALAWDVIRRETVIVRLHCSLTQYLNGPVPTVDVFQASTKDRFGLGHQLKKIMQTFVTQQWKHQSEEKLNSLHNKNKKKVKSPLHIFSTLRRSPSYPPPGCVKSKKNLKPEQDGVSKSHRLLGQTCSSTVKQQVEAEVPGTKTTHRLLGQTCSSTVKQQVEAEVPGTKTTHRLLGQSLSSTDPRLDHGGGPCPGPLPLKPRRILGRPCSALVKPEDLRPTPHKLLPRLCSGDPRCEHAGGGGGSLGGGLKHHRLLSRSCSGSIRTEELDGLKHHHHLLSRSYSSSTKMGKAADIFKDSVSPSEGRRLSLTSGLIGILAPSLATPPPPNNGAKSIPIRDRGFLVQTMEYAEQRTPVLNEFCVVCDEPHVFQNGPMLRPTVCERELCVFAFQTLGVMNEAADEIATGAQVVDLLVSMCRSALESPRKVVIFEPYPSVVDPCDSQALAFNPRKKDYDRVMRALDSLTSIREMSQSIVSLQAPYLEVKRQMDKHDPLAHPLLQWVISSNRSHIVKLPVTRQLKFMHTPHQFLLLNSPPAKESNFRAAKNLFGSTFAFHGSHIENWHSILRNGLVVASNTRLQLHGAIYGSGIYLSPMSSISFGYSGMNKKQQKVASKDQTATNKTNLHLQSTKKGQQPQFLQSRNLKCIALCEVITSPDLHKHGDIWVVPNTDHVCTRFFFVYEDGQVGDTSINTQDAGIHREIIRVIGNQTATG